MAKKTPPREVALLAELQRRQQQAAEKAAKPKFDFHAFTFEKQREFFLKPGVRFRAAVCSRRAGKSVGIAADMVQTCTQEAGIICLYITLTRSNAKNILWFELKNILQKYEIAHKADDHELVITFPNKSRIHVAGAKDRQEIEKYRGWKLRKCYIDECQSFRPYLKDLINDVITPALRDLRGELFLTGTPGPVPAGFFYECTHSDFWENFYWTAFDNPHMHDPANGKDLELTLSEERTMKGIDATDPSYIRETYGKWVEDTNSLVFKYSRAINGYNLLPQEGRWTYIFGVDIGYDDADAIAVLGYNDKVKKVFLVEEEVTSKQDITTLVNKIKKLQSQYDPVKIVMDAGALGKKIQEEILVRHTLHMESADKHRKVEYIELLNDDLRTGKFQARENSAFAEDCMLVQWDRESRIRNPEKPKISDTYHSDITDAVLYAWRECRHYLSESDKPKLSSNEYMDELHRKEAEKMQNRANNPFYDIEEAFEADFDSITDIDEF